MLGIFLSLFVGLIILPVICGLYFFKHSKKAAFVLFCIPVTLLLIGGSWYVYENNFQFVKSTNLSAIQYLDIKVGDSMQDVVQIYGTNHYSRVEQGMSVLGYVDRSNNTFIEFWHDNDEVYEIRSNVN